MVKELMQAFVVLLLAIPFIYMAYDVARELSRNMYKMVKVRVIPTMTHLFNMTINR